jgi:O-acetylhomoserine/O-acetylserine sulfhydrylase-like pyridoxal-dependent enzyme
MKGKVSSGLQELHPSTRVLTEGFDPHLSVGSARPAVFRSSTYVFSTPEAAERAFNITAGRAQRDEHEQVDLIYSLFNHPYAEILEEQLVPLERGAETALVFNSGMAAIMTALFCLLKPGQTVVYTTPIYGGTLQFLRDFLPRWGVRGLGRMFVREVHGVAVQRWYENLTGTRELADNTAVRHFNVMHHMMEKASTIWSKETGIDRKIPLTLSK